MATLSVFLKDESDLRVRLYQTFPQGVILIQGSHLSPPRYSFSFDLSAYQSMRRERYTMAVNTRNNPMLPIRRA